MVLRMGGLSQPQRRFLPYVRSGLTRGMSGNAIIQQAREAGIGFNRQGMLRAVKFGRDEQAIARSFNFTRGDRRPAYQKLTVYDIGVPQNKYAIRYQVTVKDNDTGLISTRDITLGIDEEYTIDELHNLAAATYEVGIEAEGYLKNYEFVSVRPAPIGHRRAP